MSGMTVAFLVAIGVIALASIPFVILARRDFARLGRWSLPVALASGVLMHGLALAILGLAFSDRGSLYAVTPVNLVAGLVLATAGGWMIHIGRRRFGSTARVYGLREDELIEQGVYRHSRNPQYVGYFALMLGSSLASGSALALGGALVFAAFIHVFVTGVEEPHLRRDFGDAYRAYCGRVRRYL
ncbi:methyltransferase family protein [Devosia sp.]|uniref:methyltransferase family protein n=1 Tax=Devosia sp. TaxID=1871048 RepID=UPI003A945B8E